VDRSEQIRGDHAGVSVLGRGLGDCWVVKTEFAGIHVEVAVQSVPLDSSCWILCMSPRLLESKGALQARLHNPIRLVLTDQRRSTDVCTMFRALPSQQPHQEYSKRKC
jgi:hypothetical protein